VLSASSRSNEYSQSTSPQLKASLKSDYPLNSRSDSVKMSIALTGHCTCGSIRYSATLESADAARTSLCHCGSCRRAFGTNYGLTTKVDTLSFCRWAMLTSQVPLEGFKYESGKAKLFQQENGVIREFCNNCGVFICEYGVSGCVTASRYVRSLTSSQEQAAQTSRYVMWGTFDEPDKVPPKGEFFCKNRVEWMPEIPGMLANCLRRQS